MIPRSIRSSLFSPGGDDDADKSPATCEATQGSILLAQRVKLNQRSKQPTQHQGEALRVGLETPQEPSLVVLVV